VATVVLHQNVALFYFLQPQVFNANYFTDKIATQRLAQTIFSRFIRLHPQEYVNTEAMRLGLWGCYVGKSQ
jgi:hypothetical protein